MDAAYDLLCRALAFGALESCFARVRRAIKKIAMRGYPLIG